MTVTAAKPASPLLRRRTGPAGEAARKHPAPSTTSPHPDQSRLCRRWRDHQAARATANTRSVAAIGAARASGPKASAVACQIGGRRECYASQPAPSARETASVPPGVAARWPCWPAGPAGVAARTPRRTRLQQRVPPVQRSLSDLRYSHHVCSSPARARLDRQAPAPRETQPSGGGPPTFQVTTPQTAATPVKLVWHHREATEDRMFHPSAPADDNHRHLDLGQAHRKRLTVAAEPLEHGEGCDNQSDSGA